MTVKVVKAGSCLYRAGLLGLQIFGLNPDGFIRALTKGALVDAGKWVHVLAMYDGSGTATGVQVFVNGRLQSVISQGAPLKGSAKARVPLRVGRRELTSPLAGGLVQDVRVFSRLLKSGETRWLPELGNLQAALALAPEKRAQPQKAALNNYFLDVLDPAPVALAGYFGGPPFGVSLARQTRLHTSPASGRADP
jgi:Concanavalin A-like lectin/glucanases superfamily